jgi:hypothetical protein
MKNIYRIFILTLLLTSFLRCEKGFEEINIDPTQSNNLDPNLQLSKIELELAGNGGISEVVDLYLIRPFIQQMNGAWATHFGSQYIKRNDWSDSYWGYYYTSALKNLVDMVERTENNPTQINLNAIGRILKVYQFSKLTDLYGDIPYFDGARAFYGDVLNPVYDKQEDIYNDFFIELTQAVNDFTTENPPITGDFYYDGDIEKWKRFANSLRLRLAIRLSEANPTKAEIEAKAAFEAGVMTSNDDICLMRYGNFPLNDQRANPLSNAFQQNIRAAGNKLTTTLVDYMKTNQDPRLDIYGRAYDWFDVTDVTRFSGIQGLPPGAFWFDFATDKEYTDSRTGERIILGGATDLAAVSKFINNKEAPMLLFTYAESEFLVAEAAVRGWVGESATLHYENALRAGVKQMELYPNVGSISNFNTSSFINANPLIEGKEIEIINSQKWVLLFLDVIEAYSNWRRSGFPVLTPTNFPISSNPGVIPRRFEYPQSEYLFNENNLSKAVDAMGGDDWTNRVWWDRN